MNLLLKQIGLIALILTSGYCMAHSDMVLTENSGPQYRVKKVAPAGQEYFQVIAYYDEDYSPAIVVVHSAVYDKQGQILITMQQRAEMIKARLSKLQQLHPDWYRRQNFLRAHPYKNGELVISPTGIADVDYIATADEQSVRPLNCQTREQLAKKLQDMIRAVFYIGPLKGPQRKPAIQGLETPESLAVEADRFYEDNPARAIELYKKALTKARGQYIYVELCLAQLYLNQPDGQKLARPLLEAAGKQHPSAEERKQIDDLMAQL